MSRPDAPEAIAIIGLAGRFPQARHPAEFWRNLRAGREAVQFFRDDQVQWLPLEHPPRLDDPAFVRARAILDRPEWFDAGFFGLNPREAAVMDPQHRVFLECAWEALEDAGCNPENFPGLIGVFAGASMNTYLFNNLLSNRGLVENLGFFGTMLANDNDFVPTRVSYKLNLRGPSLNVQTACSTSLVAVCLAAQNLLAYRCDAALAGGVSITFPPHRGQHHVEGGIHSHDGHCRAFSAGATGTVLGDGAGIVVLKRLSDALADGDPIRAVIRGTAINNDGAVKIGYTAPSSNGQAEAIALAHAEAGFAPETVSYIEAHGTGTPLGDPIEVEGLVKAFGLRGERGQFCGLGSVKTNIGHLDITAGVAGLIKTVLALEARELPPSLHFDRPNPKIDFAASPFYVVDSLRPWPRGATPRRAGVSSFGIGGTNAHVALEEAPELPAGAPATPRELLVLSARSAPALAAAAARLADRLEAQPPLNLGDVAWTLQTGRKAFAHRRALVVTDLADAVRRLREPAASQPPAPDHAPSVVYLFPGQGAQAIDMGRGLYDSEPTFRQSVDECCRLLQPHLDLDLRGLLFPPADAAAAAARRLEETALTQPALFAIEYSLARLWEHRGLRPHALIGHSLGEYVAACVAGVFTLPDALALVATRARLMQAQPRGAMLAVRLPEAEVAALVGGGIDLAAVNAPGLCVLSGPVDAIAALEQSLITRGVATKRLATSHAFHSPAMEPVRAPFLSALRRISLQAPRLPCLSNLTGQWLTAAQATDPEYWAAHLRQPVRFADGLATVMREAPAVLLEVGPGQTLATLARQHPATDGHATVACSLGRRPGAEEDRRAFLEAAGRLWVAGVPLLWSNWHTETRRRVPLPTYPFERQRHWIEPGAAHQRPAGGPSPVAVPVPGEGAAETVATPALPAGTPVAAKLAPLFTELAGHDFTGENIHRTFQELGLDSLALTQASFALRERFGLHVTMRQLLEEYSTLAKLAAHLDVPAPIAPPADAAPAPASPPAPPPSLPLTLGQREIWYVTQLGPELSAAYNESATLHLRGPLDEGALTTALQALVARHDALRITLSADGETQRITPTAPALIGRTDLSGVPRPEQPGRLEQEIDRLIGEPFDLVAGPLWRVHLVRLAPDRHALVAAFHHIICDGWSRSVLLQELGELYSAARQGRAAALPAADSFAAYVREEVARRDSAATKAAEQFWQAQFPTGAPVLELPSDRPRPALRTHAASYRHRRLEPSTAAAIRRLAAEHDSTHFTVLLAGFATLLHRCSGQDDLVIGVPAAPQILAGLKGLAGHCVNLLPVRSRLEADQPFAGFLQAMRRTTLDAFEHWHHPFASLLRQLNLPRDPNRVPLANVTFNVGRQRGPLRFDGLAVEAANNPKRFVNFDLSFNVTETEAGLELDCHFSTELFDAATIERHLDRYELILRAAATDPAGAVARLPLLTPAEQRQVLVEWNRTAIAYPLDRCLHELFEHQAARTPGATALVCGAERWTYRRLNEAANQLAHRLRRLGVKPETPVGLVAHRTAATVAAVLGILKAGGAYIPLDPAYPAERTAYMLADSRAALIVTDGSRPAAGPATDAARLVDLAAARSELARESTEDPAPAALPGHLAYVIYTSGSTGRPKGVAIEHRAAVNFVHWARGVFSPAELAGVLAGTSLCFDLSVFELFVPLACGGTVILADHALHLRDLPARDEVTLINTVPSAIAELLRLAAVPSSVRTVNLAGEPVPTALVDRLYALPHITKVHDLYGPSETTTYSTFALRRRGELATIGRPLANTQVYLLDRQLELVPPGVPGELCIAGEGLARGYLNQPVLTAQRFVPLPFDSQAGARLYRTGDLARHRPDGMLEFLGRLDHQVKIRGYRIELGEVETVLRRQPGVRECVVVVTEPSPGDRQLAAYVGGPEGATDDTRLRAALARLLPDYMVPHHFVFLERLPLTPTGKIDRRALPAPSPAAVARREGGTPPRTVTEEVLAGIWGDVLRLPQVGIHDNFFELGGHSLLVTQALARIQQAFGVELPLRQAFEAPTIAELASAIENALVEDLRASEPEPAHAAVR